MKKTILAGPNLPKGTRVPTDTYSFVRTVGTGTYYLPNMLPTGYQATTPPIWLAPARLAGKVRIQEPPDLQYTAG